MGMMNQKNMSHFALLWRTGDLKTVEDVRARVLELTGFLAQKELAAITLREFNKRYGPLLSKLKVTMMEIAQDLVEKDLIYMVMRDNRMWLIHRGFESDLIKSDDAPPEEEQIQNMINAYISYGTEFFGLKEKARAVRKEKDDDFSFRNHD